MVIPEMRLFEEIAKNPKPFLVHYVLASIIENIKTEEYMLIATYDKYDIVILKKDLEKGLWKPRMWKKQ